MGASGAELVVTAIGVSAVIAAGYSIHRAYKSVRRWVESLVESAKNGFSDAVDSSATGHLVKYHLGPNGTTTPMHVRVTENQATELRHHQQNSGRLDDLKASVDQITPKENP